LGRGRGLDRTGDLISPIGYRIADGEFAPLTAPATFYRARERDSAPGVGSEADAFEIAVSRRLGLGSILG
jgi:hypothetical protein